MELFRQLNDEQKDRQMDLQSYSLSPYCDQKVSYKTIKVDQCQMTIKVN